MAREKVIPLDSNKVRVTATFDLDIKGMYKGSKMSPQAILNELQEKLSKVEGLITHIPFAGYTCKTAYVPVAAKTVVKAAAKKVAKKTAKPVVKSINKGWREITYDLVEEMFVDPFADDPKPTKKKTPAKKPVTKKERV